MKGPPPPLRFLALVLGGWTLARATLLVPASWTVPVAPAEAQPTQSAPLAVEAPPAAREPARIALWRAAAPLPAPAPLRQARPVPAAGTGVDAHIAPAARPVAAASAPPIEIGAAAPLIPAAPSARHRPSRRWSLSAWSFLRGGEGEALAAGGTLGGSQAGLRATMRLGRRLAVAGRLSSPMRRRGAEAALGLDVQPFDLPLHILAERRQRLGPGGRSAFAVTLYGGASELELGPLRLDAYGQAGAVGARSRDLFADAGATVALPLGNRGRLRLGGGVWAAAQPGVARADAGPHAALRLPVGGKAMLVAADWRLRLAGDARPGSGPTLTLAADF